MLQDLCGDLIAAKQTMAFAKNEVLRIEKLILDLSPEKLEGSQTLTPPGFKLTITSKLTRKLDYDAYQALGIHSEFEFVTLKPAIDLAALRIVEELNPALVASCVTTKPAKTAIKVEVSDES